jgi:hypothetical protein
MMFSLLIEDYTVTGAAVWSSRNTSIVDSVGSNTIFNPDGDDSVSGTFVRNDAYRLAQTKVSWIRIALQMYC